MTIRAHQLAPEVTSGSGGERHGCATCPIRASCLLGELNEESVARDGQVITMRRRILRNSALFNIGSNLSSIYAVRLGQFKLCGTAPTGNEVVTRFGMPSELLGFDAIAIGRHQFRAIALEDSEVCTIPFTPVDKLISIEPRLRQQFLRALSNDAIVEFHRAAILLNLRSDQRLARFFTKSCRPVRFTWLFGTLFSPQHVTSGYCQLSWHNGREYQPVNTPIQLEPVDPYNPA